MQHHLDDYLYLNNIRSDEDELPSKEDNKKLRSPWSAEEER